MQRATTAVRKFQVCIPSDFVYFCQRNVSGLWRTRVRQQGAKTCCRYAPQCIRNPHNCFHLNVQLQIHTLFLLKVWSDKTSRDSPVNNYERSRCTRLRIGSAQNSTTGSPRPELRD